MNLHDYVETVVENLPQSQNFAINKKSTHNCRPIFMKLGENIFLKSTFGC